MFLRTEKSIALTPDRPARSLVAIPTKLQKKKKRNVLKQHNSDIRYSRCEIIRTCSGGKKKSDSKNALYRDSNSADLLKRQYLCSCRVNISYYKTEDISVMWFLN